MRKLVIFTLTIAAFTNTALAGSWDDALSFQDSFRINSGLTTPTTNLYVQTQAGGGCGSTGGPTLLATSNISQFSMAPCASTGAMRIDLNQFVRQSDLAGQSAQIAAVNAQINQSLQSQIKLTNGGVAQALAMAGTSYLQPDENLAVSANIGTFGGETAFAGGATARLGSHVALNGGLTAGSGGGQVGGRAGIRFGW